MQALSRCALCDKYLANSVEGRAVHMQQFHNVRSVQRDTLPLSPQEKAAIVAKGEERLGLRHFIVPEVARPTANRCNACGPTNRPGYWLLDGTGICEACLRTKTQEGAQ